MASLRSTGGPDVAVVSAGVPPLQFGGPHRSRVEHERVAQEAAMRTFAAGARLVGHASVSRAPELDSDDDYADFCCDFAADVAAVLVPLLRHR